MKVYTRCVRHAAIRGTVLGASDQSTKWPGLGVLRKVSTAADLYTGNSALICKRGMPFTQLSMHSIQPFPCA